jgi:hypothetical protein
MSLYATTHVYCDECDQDHVLHEHSSFTPEEPIEWAAIKTYLIEEGWSITTKFIDRRRQTLYLCPLCAGNADDT